METSFFQPLYICQGRTVNLPEGFSALCLNSSDFFEKNGAFLWLVVVVAWSPSLLRCQRWFKYVSILSQGHSWRLDDVIGGTPMTKRNPPKKAIKPNHPIFHDWLVVGSACGRAQRSPARISRPLGRTIARVLDGERQWSRGKSWVCKWLTVCYWKLPFIGDLPIKYGDFTINK